MRFSRTHVTLNALLSVCTGSQLWSDVNRLVLVRLIIKAIPAFYKIIALQLLQKILLTFPVEFD